MVGDGVFVRFLRTVHDEEEDEGIFGEGIGSKVEGSAVEGPNEQRELTEVLPRGYRQSYSFSPPTVDMSDSYRTSDASRRHPATPWSLIDLRPQFDVPVNRRQQVRSDRTGS